MLLASPAFAPAHVASPPVAGGFAPASLDTGFDFLARLPLANPPLAEARLHEFLDTFALASLSPADRFVLLENAAEPLYFVREAQARHYQDKALHLDEEQEAHFRRGSGIWQKMVDAYACCLEQANGADMGRVATLLHRCLHYLALCGRDHFLARRQLPEGFWQQANGFYARAEALGVSQAQVETPLAEIEGRSQRCIDAYVTLLLLDLASPYGRSLSDFNLIWLLADHWAPLVRLREPAPGDVLPRAVVNLQGDQPVQFLADGEAQQPHFRLLDCTDLVCQLKQSGRDGALLPRGLSDAERIRLETLRHHLLKAWHPRPLGRRFPRSSDSGVVEVGIGIQHIHALIRARQEGGAAWRRQDIDFLLWDEMEVPAHAGMLLDHSANGFRILLQPPFGRVAHGQLLALRPHDGEDYLLAQVQWLIQCQDGSLMVGLTVLPGVPRAVAVRPQGKLGKYQRAFMLPAFPLLGELPSLVLPVGLYQTQEQRSVEVFDGTCRTLTLSGRLQGGMDFERVCYRE